jgi:hypothetical protein
MAARVAVAVASWPRCAPPCRVDRLPERWLAGDPAGKINPPGGTSIVANFTWSGTSGGDWTTQSDWTPNGDPAAGDNVFINTAGTYSVTITTDVAAGSVKVNDANATLSDGDALTLSGGIATLNVTAGTFQLNSGGSVVGGTIVAGAKGVFDWGDGALSGVTFDGVLSLMGGKVQIEHGLTLQGANGSGVGTIDVSGAGATMSLIGATILDNASLNIGAFTAAKRAVITGSEITLGSKLTLSQTEPDAAIVSSAWVQNLGAMNLAVKSGQFGLSSVKSLSNGGTLSVSNGDAVRLTDDGVINETSGTISVKGAGASLLLDSPGTFFNEGAATAATDSKLVIDANVANTGQLSASGDASLMVNGSLTGKGGSLLIYTGGSTTLNGAVASTQTVEFLDATGTLNLHLPKANSFAGGIAGFSFVNASIYDKIDLIDTPATAVTSTADGSVSAELTVSNGAKVVATLDLVGNYMGQTFQVATDTHGGTIITLKQDTLSVAGAHHFAQAAAAFAAPAGGAGSHLLAAGATSELLLTASRR